MIERLFSEGKSISKFPVKIFYLPLENSAVHQATFSVPKRNFKSAVTRNRIKRQLRESYRLHKQMLSHKDGRNFALLILYIGKNKPQFAQLDSSIKALLKQLKP